MSAYVILLPVLLRLAAASYDPTICTLPLNTGSAQHPLPQLPSTFEAHIEMKLLTLNTTVFIREYFDQRSNQSAVRLTRKGSDVRLFLHYDSQELLTIDTNKKTCQVSDLSKSKERFIYGSAATPSSVLHLGSSHPQTYQGLDTKRGIIVQKWLSCQYSTDMDATMNVTWYFAVSASWDNALGMSVVPVRAWVKGRVGSSAGKPTHDFEHIYDIYHFVNYITNPEAFQIPRLVSCPGSKLTKTFPTLPQSFSLTTEVVTTSLQPSVSYVQQWFDSKMGLAKHIYHTAVTMDWTSEIHDYHAGVAYITDLKLGNCTCLPIEGGDNDDIVTDSRHVRMMTPLEFFNMNITNITYQGVKPTRYISADVFVAERSDYPAFQPVRTIWEWHFTQNNETSLPPGTLIQTVLYMPGIDKSIIYNMFDLVHKKIDMSTWDISACYNNLARRIFEFSVPGNNTKIIQINPPLFQYGISLSLILIAGVSPLRIANMQFQYSTNVLVTFDLLDIPPVTGDVKFGFTPVPLDVAAKRITDSFGDFVIYYPYKQQPYDVSAVPFSLMELKVGPSPATVSTTTRAPTPSPTTMLPQTSSTPLPTLPYGPTMSTVNVLKPIPNLPVSFEVHIKRVMSEMNTSTETHEVYDQTSGQLSLRKLAQGIESLSIINITGREVHSIDRKQKTCKVSSLPAGNLDTVIGYTSDKFGKGEIISLAGALVYGGNRTYRYLGREVIREINCLKWSLLSVTLGGDSNNIMDIMWYFSDPNTWDTALNWPWSPVRAVVIGQDISVTPSIYYENVYDFIHFKNFIEVKNAFRTPDFVTCTGRTPVKKFPSLATAFSFTVEILGVLKGGKVISDKHVWFDNQIKIAKYVSTGKVPLTTIHDFNTGVAYVIDNTRGNCSVSPLLNTSNDVHIKTLGSILMKTSGQLFHMDISNYTYEGTDMLRDIPVDRFVGTRTDFPDTSPTFSTFEWRFTTGQYSRVQQDQDMYSDGVPVQMKITMPSFNISLTYNVFNFVQSKPDLLKWNIGPCYLNRDRRRFQFALPRNYTKQIYGDQPIFKYAALISLETFLAVSSLRISNLELRFGKDVIFSFTVLDVAPIPGDVKTTTRETPLNVAASLLKSAILNNKFAIMLVGAQGNTQSVIPIPSSLQELYEGPDVSNIPTVTPKSQTSMHTAKTQQPSARTHHSVSVSPVTRGQNTRSTTAASQKTSFNLPGSTSANVLCSKDGSGYSTGIVVGVSVVMVIAGGAGGTGLAIYVKRKRGRTGMGMS